MDLDVLNKVELIQEEIESAFFDIPFGSSQFQIDHFVVNKESDSRAYRQVGLEINNKLQALSEAKFRRRKLAVEIKIAEREIDQESDELKKELVKIDLEQKLYHVRKEDKLIRDAAVELDRLYKHYKSLPKLTREEFEKQEQEYWQKRLLMDAQREIIVSGGISTGTQHSLQQIGINPIQALTEVREIINLQLETTRKNMLIGNGEK